MYNTVQYSRNYCTHHDRWIGSAIDGGGDGDGECLGDRRLMGDLRIMSCMNIIGKSTSGCMCVYSVYMNTHRKPLEHDPYLHNSLRQRLRFFGICCTGFLSSLLDGLCFLFAAHVAQSLWVRRSHIVRVAGCYPVRPNSRGFVVCCSTSCSSTTSAPRKNVVGFCHLGCFAFCLVKSTVLGYRSKLELVNCAVLEQGVCSAWNPKSERCC